MMHRTSGRVLLIVAAFVLFLVPVAAIAAAGFSDVADDNVFVADIQWMKDNGITRGCNPPTNDRFCPGSNVTREQMAAFMHRLATGEVVDAATAVEADNADTLDGMGSTAFVQKGEANSVSSSMMTDSPGIAQATQSSAVLLPSNTGNVLSVEVDVPAAGYVLVQSTLVLVVNHLNGAGDLCLFDVSAVDGASMPSEIDPGINIPAILPSAAYTHMPAVSRVYPVSAAGTHTFYLVGQEIEGDCWISDVVLTALYVPVAYGTVAAAP